MGGAAGVGLLLGMVRVKFAAVLVGATGVGLIATFSVLQGFVGTLAGLGLQSSAVREIAVAVAAGDGYALGRLVLVLRRLCWLAGMVGMVALMVLGPQLSYLTFGHRGYAFDISVLGVVILFGNLSAGQQALMQGARRIGDLARVNINSAVVGTLVAIGFYMLLGLRGIIPALLSAAAAQLAFSWYFARRVPTFRVVLSWRQTFVESKKMISLGLVMMWNALMGSAIAYLTITLIAQQEGVNSVGLYSAAFALSGVFVNFVLGAMGADFYPRLTAVSTNMATMNRNVNEQIEIGLLFALPGLLGTMTLASWVLQIFYSSDFFGATVLIQWFILGCLGRVISWPMGYVMLALDRGGWFLIVETSFNLLHVVLIFLGLHFWGVEGVAIAFFLLYMGYTFAAYQVSRFLCWFTWSVASRRLALHSLWVLGATFAAARLLSPWLSTLLGLVLTLAATFLCLRGLVERVGVDARVVRFLHKLPCGRFLLACCMSPGRDK